MVYRIFVEKKPGLDNEAQGLLREARSLLGLTGLENIRLFNRYDAVYPMVYRIFVEKKPGLDNEAQGLLREARSLLGLTGLENIRLFNRYDAENITQELFDYAVKTVFSEPQLDIATAQVDLPGAFVFAVEALPGQFDQRSDSAAQCIQIISQGERPTVRTAKVYALYGQLTQQEIDLFKKHVINARSDSAAQCIQIISQGERPTVRTAKVYALYGQLTQQEIDLFKKHVINAVESREASLEKPETLAHDIQAPQRVATVEGFTTMDRQGLGELLDSLGLAMDLDDLTFLQGYFRDQEHRDPTITEIRVVDTYWSDHCRHTTFSTHLDNVEIHDPLVRRAYERRYLAAREEVYGKEKAAARPQTLMDIATPSHGDRALRRRGNLHRRLHPGSPVRPGLCPPGHAGHRRCGPPPLFPGNPGGQAAPAEAVPDRCRRIFLLRQPDWPGNRPCG